MVNNIWVSQSFPLLLYGIYIFYIAYILVILRYPLSFSSSPFSLISLSSIAAATAYENIM